MTNPFSPLSEGTVLQGRYRIKRLIGKGGMGAVYEAREDQLGNLLAIKQNFYGGDERLKRAFEHEARLLANLRHESLPRVTHYFTEDFGQFLVMEFIEGDDLMTLLKLRGVPFQVEQVLVWADQLLNTLEYLHKQNPPIIHRDIKPQNLKLSSSGNIMLLDFGLAKGTTAGLTSVMAGSSLQGFTPGYAPLEQMTGKVTDERSDLYALAATLYHLLTNEPPPDAVLRSGALTLGDYDPLTPASQINPVVPPALSQLLFRSMAHKRDERPRTATEMRETLRKLRVVEGSKGIHDAGTVIEASRQTEPIIVEEVHNRAGALKPISTVPTSEVSETGPAVPPRKKITRKAIVGLVSIAAVLIVALVFLANRMLTKPQVNVPSGPAQSAAQKNQTAPPSSGAPGSSPTNAPANQSANAQAVLPNPPASDKTISIDLGIGVRMTLVPIPAGSFTMGGDQNDNEKPAHQVTITRPFYMGKTEVTQSQWEAVKGSNPSHFKNCGADCPVESVSWTDAHDFIRLLNAKQSQYTFRLPTEAEWEYSAKGRTTNDSGDKGWYRDNSSAKPHSVGQKPANSFGLYDMIGNVFEWVEDWYDPTYYISSPNSDPKGPSSGQFRVLRGGSWDTYNRSCRPAFRYGLYAPNTRNYSFGFRLVALAKTP